MVSVARLHEHQGKANLAKHGVATPRGGAASSAADAERIARELGGPAVVKIQAFTTSRKALGGVAVVDSPEEARREAERMLAMRVGAFPVEAVLVEEALPVARELFLSLSVSDADRAPVLLLSAAGGSGVEERAAAVQRISVDVRAGVEKRQLERALEAMGLDDADCAQVRKVAAAMFDVARAVEARSVEINPLALLEDGKAVALDCRIAVDDYAVFRHPELEIEIAREFDHPPTTLEKIAYAIERADHRGTFYFAQLPEAEANDARLVGFHGAGGGGSMMSMDALASVGFTPANFTDTSGNPSSAKVYAAARIILAQPGLVGYFGSGSGVASQEQHHSAYGLAKAFLELGLDIPALIRLGGNSEGRAVAILHDACKDLAAPVEGATKDDAPRFIAERFRALVDASAGRSWMPRERRLPSFVGSAGALSFPVRFGEGWEGACWVDVARCPPEAADMLAQRFSSVFTLRDGGIQLACAEDDARARDTELIAAEIECWRLGAPAVFVDIPIPGLDEPAPLAESKGASVAASGGAD